MNLRLGFSTCPNDTFMFDAMVNGRIDTEGLSFETSLADIAQLNQQAATSDFDIIKISYAFYPQVSDKYQILLSGSALGYGNGPLLVAKRPIIPSEMDSIHVAIPGTTTTANLLFSAAFPKVTSKTECLFSDIEDWVLNGKVDAGLLIHENRFTYAERGLQKLADMGEWWESQTGMPVPLGGIMVKRSMPEALKASINRVMHSSVAYAFEHPDASLPFIRKYAQSMKDEVMKQHIALYVNKFSLELGIDGKKAVETFFERTLGTNQFKKITRPIFIS
jgi:1,4-dihydroxy-6-naphthoate synthase